MARDLLLFVSLGILAGIAIALCSCSPRPFPISYEASKVPSPLHGGVK